MSRTHQRNNQWANPISFYLNEIKYAPNFARIHNNLAMEYADINQFKKAIFYFNKSLTRILILVSVDPLSQFSILKI